MGGGVVVLEEEYKEEEGEEKKMDKRKSFIIWDMEDDEITSTRVHWFCILHLHIMMEEEISSFTISTILFLIPETHFSSLFCTFFCTWAFLMSHCYRCFLLWYYEFWFNSIPWIHLSPPHGLVKISMLNYVWWTKRIRQHDDNQCWWNMHLCICIQMSGS